MYSVTVLFDLAVLLFSTVSMQMRILLYKWAHKMRLTEEHKATAERSVHGRTQQAPGRVWLASAARRADRRGTSRS